MRDGEYVAWFRTPQGSGTGRVRFKDGELSGSDSILSYAGSYSVNGNRFAAKLCTRRHTAGHDSLLGADEAALTLEGVSHGRVAMCSGCFEGFSEVVIEVTLIRVQVEELQKPFAYRREDFHPERLPKGNVR
jgi:hypothetical protein